MGSGDKAKFKVGDRVRDKEVPEAGVGIIERIKPEGGYSVHYKDTWFGHCHDEDETLEPAPITIESGKFYRTRDGQKVGPMLDYDWPVDSAVIEIKGDGRCWRKGSGKAVGYEQSNGDDLIAEWVDEPAANDEDVTDAIVKQMDELQDWMEGKDPVAVAASNDNAPAADKPAAEQPVAKFKVGDVVEDVSGFADGEIVTITKLHANGDVSIRYKDGTPGRWPETHYKLVEPKKSVVLVGTAIHIGDGLGSWSQIAGQRPAIVCLIENGQPKPADRPHVHSSATNAEREAARLAGKHKGKEFGVFELVSSKREEAPVSVDAALRELGWSEREIDALVLGSYLRLKSRGAIAA